MRIFTKKCFEFKGPNGDLVTTKTLDFAEVPEWVAVDPYFLLVVKDGDAQVFGENKVIAVTPIGEEVTPIGEETTKKK